MDQETFVALAEHLMLDFPEEPLTSVIQAVTGCIDEFPNSDSMFVEQAARARLDDGA